MMNDIIHQKFNFNYNGRRHIFHKNDKRFMSNKRNLRKNSFEIKPLISVDGNSSSEDEVTLHDVQHFNHLHDKLPENSLIHLKKVKSDSSRKNGSASGCLNKSDQFQNCEFLCLNIEEGDTLQSISIKYQCPVSDIKRANNLISDQDFYALRQLKIPVKRYGLLTEILPSVSDVKVDSTIVEELENVRIINIGIGHAGRCPSPEETATFFKKMDEDLVKIMLSTQTKKESLEAAAVALTAPQIQPLVKDPYSTVDYGIQWNYLLIFLIIIAVVIPTVIALYMYMRSSHAHNQDVYSNSSSNESFNTVTKMSIKSKS